jgi:uncharacterized membrane protein
MNTINRVIVNPAFAISFAGSIAFPIIAGLFFLRPTCRPVLTWIGIAVLLNALSLIVSGVFNIPMNNRLSAANNTMSPAQYAELREAFETPWLVWNTVRGLLNTGALGILGWALVQYGRITR